MPLPFHLPALAKHLSQQMLQYLLRILTVLPYLLTQFINLFYRNQNDAECPLLLLVEIPSLQLPREIRAHFGSDLPSINQIEQIDREVAAAATAAVELIFLAVGHTILLVLPIMMRRHQPLDGHNDRELFLAWGPDHLLMAEEEEELQVKSVLKKVC